MSTNDVGAKLQLIFEKQNLLNNVLFGRASANFWFFVIKNGSDFIHNMTILIPVGTSNL